MRLPWFLIFSFFFLWPPTTATSSVPSLTSLKYVVLPHDALLRPRGGVSAGASAGGRGSSGDADDAPSTSSGSGSKGGSGDGGSESAAGRVVVGARPLMWVVGVVAGSAVLGVGI